MLTRSDALRLVGNHLGDSGRARHSLFVGHLLNRFAENFAAPACLWEVVGLCHDLDFFVTADDRSRHGILAAEWLAGLLPEEALTAIAAHDHRTGVKSRTLLADMLKLADVLGVIDAECGRDRLREIGRSDVYRSIVDDLRDRPYLPEMLSTIAGRHKLTFAVLAGAVKDAPSQ